MGMSAGTTGGRKRAVAEINVTPMVDVMLVLLVIFMITAPSIKQIEGMEVNLPELKEGSAAETTTEPEIETPPEPAPRPIITKLRIFIILSAGAHLGFLVCWGVPAYVKHIAEIRAIEEEKLHAIALKEAEKRGKLENERQK